jgi:hypothetical protein
MFRHTLTAFALSAACSLGQAATVIDFESLPPFGSPNPVVAGLAFTSTGFADVWINNPNGNGTQSLINGYGPLTIAPVGGGSFDLLRFDWTISWYNDDPQSDVTLTAHFAAGGSTSFTETLFQGLSTYTFNLFGLSSIVIDPLPDQSPQSPPTGYPGYWLMDNLVVDNVRTGVIPLPAGVWLLGSGLLALLGIQRRHRRA